MPILRFFSHQFADAQCVPLHPCSNAPHTISTSAANFIMPQESRNNRRRILRLPLPNAPPDQHPHPCTLPSFLVQKIEPSLLLAESEPSTCATPSSTYGLHPCSVRLSSASSISPLLLVTHNIQTYPNISHMPLQQLSH